MIITVLWEDSRGVEVKGFGPHELLVTCVADKLRRGRQSVASYITSVPKKGAGNVLKALEQNLPKFVKKGPVLAVIDRDKAREIWKPGPLPANCMTAIRERIAKDVTTGGYELVFLVQNMESLIDACDEGVRADLGGQKPTPDQRDRILGKAAWDAPVVPRSNILAACPSFSRLVDRVSDKLVSPALARGGTAL